jgi:hypothetical protein
MQQVDKVANGKFESVGAADECGNPMSEKKTLYMSPYNIFYTTVCNYKNNQHQNTNLKFQLFSMDSYFDAFV